MVKKGIVFFTCLMMLFGFVGLSLSGDYPSKQEVVKFVEEGMAYAKEHGRDAFFKELMNPKGPFVRGELYFYAYDYNGVVLAHGAEPQLVGRNLYDMVDKKGNKLIQELIKAARSGGGWVEYYWPNPISKKIELKLGYAVPFDDTWWFGSGTYPEN